MKEYIVVAKDEPSIDRVDAALTVDTTKDNKVDSNIVPDRAVQVANPRLANPRITHYYLTDAEAAALKKFPGVEAVHTPPADGTKIPFVIRLTDTVQKPVAYNNVKGNFNRNSTADRYNVNWGLRRTSVTASEIKIGSTYTYDADGAGVDVIIMDDGVQTDHPEFLDATGISRVQQIDWYLATGVPGQMPPNHYKVNNYAEGEHGTHVAATAAGKTFGYAKKARIYSIRIFGDNTQIIPDADQFDLIRIWHSKKPIDPATGVPRPTIVNMSWGYSWYYKNYGSSPIIDSIRYRSTLYPYSTPVGPQITYGQLNDSQSRHGFIVPSVDAEAQDCEAVGVIMVHAAGNSGHKIDIGTGVDYNNYYTTTQNWGGMIPPGQPIYYHRGSSPVTTNGITVSAGDDITVLSGGKLKDRIGDYSERGPGCDVIAPGTNITAATSKQSSFSPLPYVWKSASSADIANKVCKISGTSMASPQVAGVLALYLSRNPTAKPSDVKKWLADTGVKSQVLTSLTNNDWTNRRALLTGPNNYLYNPYRGGYKDKS